jgi:uncharacterized LabA/DUF88 family protein
VPTEPTVKRAVAFFDGQNLFHSVREAFGYTYPNYDPIALATTISQLQSWNLSQIRFYTGIPDPQDNAHWHQFWTAKLGILGTRGVYTYSRPLRYRYQRVRLPDGTQHSYLAGHEKGMDVRIALDVIRLALDGTCDVALIFSQDQDLSEAADEVRSIARQGQRWIKIASAFPASPTYRNKRGINKTDWIRFDKTLYDKCLDPNDYRVAQARPNAASISGTSISSAPPLTNLAGSNS